MKRKRRFITSMFIIGFLLFPFVVGAEEKAAEKKAEDSKPFGEWSWLSRGQKLGPWWLVSSKFYDPPPKQLLYDIDTNLSYSDLGGNVEGEIWSVSGKLVLRKAFLSSYTDYSFSRTETTVIAFDSTTVVEKEAFTEVLRYDFLKWLALEGGLNLFNDSAKFYDDSYSVFGGVSVWPLNKTELWVKLSAFYAHGEINYRNDLLESSYIEMPAYDSGAFFGQETLRWQITKMFSLTQYFDYMYSFDDADPSLIYGVPRTEESNVIRWNFRVMFRAMITPTIYFFTKYTILHDENPLADTQASVIKYEEDDTSLSVGFGLVW